MKLQEELETEAKNSKGEEAKANKKHKTSRGAGSGSIKNLTASTSLLLTFSRKEQILKIYLSEFPLSLVQY